MQTEIYTKQRVGINGQISKAESQYLATIQGVAIEDLTIGEPVAWANENENEVAKLTDENKTKFVGFVVRDGYVPSCETPTEIYKAGRNVTIITKGSLWIKSELDAKQGDQLQFENGEIIVSAFIIADTTANPLNKWRVVAVDKDSGLIEISTEL